MKKFSSTSAFENDINEVFDSNFSYSSDDDIDDLYHELYDSLVRVNEELKTNISKIELILDKIKQSKKENHDLNLFIEQLLSQNRTCVECEILKAKNLELSNALENFINNKNRLNIILEN